MPLDADAAAILDAMAATGMPDFSELSPAEARKRMEEAPPLPIPLAPVAKAEDRMIPGPAGDIAVRIYTPEGAPGATGFPALAFFHGGGWVIGDIESHDGMARNLARDAGCVVMSVDYRLAPEHQFPAAPDDCLAATRWLADTAREIEVDASRIGVAGDSAGGNLAAVVAQRVRDEGGPGLVFQLLIYPVTGFDRDTASMLRNAEGYLLTRRAMIWFDGHYTPEEGQRTHPHAAPLLARDFSGLPPALVITAEFDPLCDEGEEYAHKLSQAGVSVEHTRYAGVFHGFFGMPGLLGRATEAQQQAAESLRKAFS